MRKSTWVVVALAAAVVGLVYWHEFRRTPPPPAETHPLIFSFQPEDVASVVVARGGQTVTLERQGALWQMTSPTRTRADQNAVNALLDGVTLARASRTLETSSTGLANFGLQTPAVVLTFRLKKGEQHTLRLGTTDFSGTSVYAQVDGSAQVMLIPQSVLQQADRPPDQWRDNSVLGISEWDVKSFVLKTPAGRWQLRRTDGDWAIEQPEHLRADTAAVNQLLSQVAQAKLAKVVQESDARRERFGLASPRLQLEVTLNSGEQRSLSLGNKVGDQYYAEDSSRPMVFLVPASLYDQLNRRLFDLRDKKLLHALPEDFSRLEYRAGNLHFVWTVDREGKWVVAEPASDRNKEVANWKVFDPLSSATANEIFDHPPPAVAALLARPAVTIELTRKDGTRKTIRLTRAEGDHIYASVSDSPGIYRLPKQTLEDLTFHAVADLLR